MESLDNPNASSPDLAGLHLSAGLEPDRWQGLLLGISRIEREYRLERDPQVVATLRAGYADCHRVAAEALRRWEAPADGARPKDTGHGVPSRAVMMFLMTLEEEIQAVLDAQRSPPRVKLAALATVIPSVNRLLTETDWPRCPLWTRDKLLPVLQSVVQCMADAPSNLGQRESSAAIFFRSMGQPADGPTIRNNSAKPRRSRKKSPSPQQIREAMVHDQDVLGLLGYIQDLGRDHAFINEFDDLARCVRAKARANPAALTRDVFAVIISLGFDLLLRCQVQIVWSLKAHDGRPGAAGSLPTDLQNGGWLDRAESICKFAADMCALRARIEHLQGLNEHDSSGIRRNGPRLVTQVADDPIRAGGRKAATA